MSEHVRGMIYNGVGSAVTGIGTVYGLADVGKNTLLYAGSQNFSPFLGNIHGLNMPSVFYHIAHAFPGTAEHVGNTFGAYGVEALAICVLGGIALGMKDNVVWHANRA